MGRRNLKIAAEMVSFFLANGFRQTSPDTPVRDASALDVRFDGRTFQVLIESPSFSGPEDGTLDTAEVFNPVFRRDYTGLHLWMAAREMGLPQVAAEILGLYDARSRALDRCERPGDFVVRLSVNAGVLHSGPDWDHVEFPLGRREPMSDAEFEAGMLATREYLQRRQSQAASDPDDDRGEVAGA